MNILRTFTTIRTDLPRVLPLLRDAAVPTWAKVALVLAAVFIVSPLNILGDIPLLGFLDDAALLAFAAHTFVKFARSRTLATD